MHDFIFQRGWPVSLLAPLCGADCTTQTSRYVTLYSYTGMSHVASLHSHNGGCATMRSAGDFIGCVACV